MKAKTKTKLEENLEENLEKNKKENLDMNYKNKSLKQKIKQIIDKKNIDEFLKDHYLILIMIFLLALVKIIVAFKLGITYNIESDDLSYIEAGKVFAKNGTITMHGVISAQIMPLMPVLIGIVSFIFGEGYLFILVLKILWAIFGILCPVFIYKTVRLFWDSPYAAISIIFFFLPNILWTDNIILTETPFLLFLSMMIYYTFKFGKDKKNIDFIMLLVSYILALGLKANIGLYPVFAGIYFLFKGHKFIDLFKKGIIALIILLIFIIPWTIRNYKIYNTFMPLTYGVGNPKLLGTYQGVGYPKDEELDYHTNVDLVANEKFKKYYEADGTIKPHLRRYVLLEIDNLKANYRINKWKETNLLSMAYSYLIHKPFSMIISIFYWEKLFKYDFILIKIVSYIELILTIIFGIYSLIKKKKVKEIIFLISVYFINIYIYAMTFSFSRYSYSLLPIRYILFGIVLGVVFNEFQNKRKKYLEEDKELQKTNKVVN